MLSLNSSPCHMPFRTPPAPSMPPETSYFPHFTTMGGAAQPPPSPQSRPATASTEGSDYAPSCPLPAPGFSPPSSSSSSTAATTPSSTTTAAAAGTASAAAATIRPPADYSNLDPNTVAEALEIARDSPDVARDPVVSGILESALSQIWGRVLGSPESYVMTTGEFAVFNFYQHRFAGNKVAIAARRRFWDSPHA